MSLFVDFIKYYILKDYFELHQIMIYLNFETVLILNVDLSWMFLPPL